MGVGFKTLHHKFGLNANTSLIFFPFFVMFSHLIMFYCYLFLYVMDYFNFDYEKF